MNPGRFRTIPETELLNHPGLVLIRCVTAGETVVVLSEGYLTAESGVPIVAIVPFADFLALVHAATPDLAESFPSPPS